MKVFLSWSGARSDALAKAFYGWLPVIIPTVIPFYSPKIEKGLKWDNELDAELKGTGYGIVFLTPDNLKSTWIHYEVGALVKSDGAMIWTFLHGVNPRDVPRPLSNYQHTVAEKEDIFEMLKSINGTLAKVGESPLGIEVLRDNFEKHWPELQENLKAAESKGGDLAEIPRKEKATLETAGNQQRITGSTSYPDVFENSWIAAPGTDSYVRITCPSVPISNELVSRIFAEINRNYPNVNMTSDTYGNTSSINIFFKEPTSISSVPDIVSLIENMTGISGMVAKIKRVVTGFPT